MKLLRALKLSRHGNERIAVRSCGRAVSDQKAGKVEYRVDKNGIVHCTIGKVSFEPGQLIENAVALIDVINKQKPAASKGVYFKRIAISTTMGPGVWVDPSSALAAA